MSRASEIKEASEREAFEAKADARQRYERACAQGSVDTGTTGDFMRWRNQEGGTATAAPTERTRAAVLRSVLARMDQAEAMGVERDTVAAGWYKRWTDELRGLVP
jgi:hypothetical protein